MIRRMMPEDAGQVEALVKTAFMTGVAPGLSQAGVQTFFRIASQAALLLRMQEDHLILVHEEAGQILGMAELKQGAHLAMLFVLPECQGRGIAKNLLNALLPHCRQPQLSVRASLNAVSFYEAVGFEKSGSPAELAGLRYQPLVCHLSVTTMPADQPASTLWQK
ncbi:GNAT family N-acetyltransferase [Photobacterium sp. GJ3]|uniref:GNAT family N-acetyltransferase n=1 Tax=Photobacterium sp. GJ3 TaxID=2829502 RepID=UPI001B8C8E1D|nr:GNAT family N-acetyltransferase [Photobacterium sp. GJ3]QUJ68970.1 GNAT family N-acetyltransferase [Photobacterium sp. GJ3]